MKYLVFSRFFSADYEFSRKNCLVRQNSENMKKSELTEQKKLRTKVEIFIFSEISLLTKHGIHHRGFYSLLIFEQKFLKV